MSIIAGSIESGDVTFEYVKGSPQRSILSTDSGMFFKHDTPPEVTRQIECAKRGGYRVRLYLGDQQTGRCWMEEWDTTGRVSCSMGPMRVPILIRTRRSMGGGAISTSCIVAIQRGLRWLYRHPTFHMPTMEVVRKETPVEGGRGKTLTHDVLLDGKEHAAFESEERAAKWCEFMRGERQRPW